MLMACNGIQNLEIDGIHFHGMMIIVMGYYNDMLIGYISLDEFDHDLTS